MISQIAARAARNLFEFKSRQFFQLGFNFIFAGEVSDAFTQFKNSGAHQKAVPKPLQEMVNEALSAIQKSESEDVAINKVEESAQRK